MNSLLNIARRLRWLGIQKNDPAHLTRRNLILNQMSIFFTVVCSLFVPLFWYAGQVIGAIGAALVAMSYAVPLFFSSKRKFTAGKVWSFLTIAVAAPLYATLLGEEFQIQLALYPAGVLPFIYFGRQKPKVVYTLFVTAAIIYLLAFLFSESGIRIATNSSFGIYIFAIVMILNSFLMTGMGLLSVNEDARKAEQELNEANADKRKLINVLCHDIANPLMLCFFAESTLSEVRGLTEKQQRDIQKLRIGLAGIKEIIDSVRVLEATEIGKLEIKPRFVDLVQVAEQLQTIFEERCRQKDIKLRIENHLTKGVGVEAEAGSLKNNVLSNLISNSLKFTEQGGEIVIRMQEYEDEKILVEVQDNGIGMPEKLRKILFKSTEPTTRRGLQGERGTGFGMPLVKTTLDKYEATIEITSTEKNSNPDRHGTVCSLIFKKSVQQSKTRG